MPVKYDISDSSTAPKETEIDAPPTFGEKAGALAYGATTGLVGGLGELEKAGLKASEYIYPLQPGEMVEGEPKMWFPTQQEVERTLGKFGIKPPREEVSGYKTAGEILGGVGTAIPSLVRGGIRAAGKIAGKTTQTREALARQAENLGFKVSPAQVRRAEPISQKGAAGWAKENQNLANKLASRGTGVEAPEISRTFISGRLKDLGREFDSLYKGKEFQIDQDAIDAIRQIAEAEAASPAVAGVSAVKQVANQILEANSELLRVATPGPKKFNITGEGLQRLRNALTERARASGRPDAHEIYNLVDTIDASIARNHPDIAKALEVLRPKYRNSIVLEDLYRSGGIRGGDIDLEKLGIMLRGKKGAVRMPGMDIDLLGEIGQELKLIPMERQAGKAAVADEAALRAFLGKGYDVLASPLRTRGFRAAQRYAATAPEERLGRLMPSTAAGTLLSDEE